MKHSNDDSLMCMHIIETYQLTIVLVFNDAYFPTNLVGILHGAVVKCPNHLTGLGMGTVTINWMV